MSERTILLGLVAAIAIGVVIVGTLSPYASASTISMENATLLTPNEIAGGGPIPPHWTMAQQEAECAAEEVNPPWYPILLSYEHHDNSRGHSSQET